MGYKRCYFLLFAYIVSIISFSKSFVYMVFFIFSLRLARKPQSRKRASRPTKAQIPAKHHTRTNQASAPPAERKLSKSFFVILFAREKNFPRSERNTGKRKLAFFCPYFSRTGGEAKASPPKMTQSTAVPRRKVFAELFSKSDRPRPQALGVFSFCALFLFTPLYLKRKSARDSK